MNDTEGTSRGLSRHIGLGQGTAFYVSAILGAGVLVLPGQVASMAGPASLLSWAFACAMGVPLAIMFAALARRYPDAGGVATYVGTAFGPTAGGLSGWLFFVAGSVGQTIVPLTGGYYVAQAFSWSNGSAYVIAGVILLVATGANLAGLRLGARVQLMLAAGVALALMTTILVAFPDMELARLTPFVPHGIGSVGEGVIVLFFAFAGWEAVAHLAEEFRDPGRDLHRAVAATIVIITVLYVGTAAAVVLTGTYGTNEVDHIAIGLLLQNALGGNAAVAAAVVALIISLGTTNAFIAGVSRLGYSLAQSHWLPRPTAHLSASSVPSGGVLTVSAIAFVGLGLAAVRGWGTETLVVVPSTLVVAVYLLAAAAGMRLLHGSGRAAAIATLGLTAIVVPAAAAHLVIPLVVVVLALLTRRLCGTTTTAPDGQHDADHW